MEETTTTMDLDYSPNLLDTPSLVTPNITNNPMLFKSSYVSTNNDRNVIDDSSSAEVKLSKIERELKQGFNQPRQPTESPFRKLAENAGSLSMSKATPMTGDDGILSEIPSTAEVMKQ